MPCNPYSQLEISFKANTSTSFSLSRKCSRIANQLMSLKLTVYLIQPNLLDFFFEPKNFLLGGHVGYLRMVQVISFGTKNQLAWKS